MDEDLLGLFGGGGRTTKKSPKYVNPNSPMIDKSCLQLFLKPLKTNVHIMVPLLP